LGQTALDSRSKVWPYYHSVSKGFLAPRGAPDRDYLAAADRGDHESL